MELKGDMPIVVTRERAFSLYLPKELSDYLPFTADSHELTC